MEGALAGETELCADCREGGQACRGQRAEGSRVSTVSLSLLLLWVFLSALPAVVLHPGLAALLP